MFLEISQNSQENTCARVSFLIKLQAEASNFIEKETLAQMFSCKFCEISKNNFLHRTPFWIFKILFKLSEKRKRKNKREQDKIQSQTNRHLNINHYNISISSTPFFCILAMGILNCQKQPPEVLYKIRFL